MHMDPAKSILDAIGMETAAKVTGKHITRVYRWTYPVEKGGTGGVIPHADALKLLKYARTKRLGLNEAHFMQSPTVVREAQRDAS